MQNKHAQNLPHLEREIIRSVAAALEEDIGTGDITAQLVPADELATAEVITRENCTFCGKVWVEETFRQLDSRVEILWNIEDGEKAQANQVLFTLKGNARALLSGERTALNFVQLLSGTATTAAKYAELVKGTKIKILDTRKTIPGLRNAQKYAVACGGCHNHRVGLYDAFLIKENHIMAAGSIAQAVAKAREIAPGKPIEVEVETLSELNQALACDVDIVMLDEMDLTEVNQHLADKPLHAELELSGGVDVTQINTQQPLFNIISRISVGALTKHCSSVDLSMRVI
ncbi:carboxylating nicotinate-nucleotide diphosphorylase [Gilvimarinus sp. SDUM040013]|uniref:nicotinate-nucleotide diphosphorylase (carboxylating) n=1 Tax=Gilvimarinus gilvus TaxID=3058038 RepID=A0ABU4RW45_9GAMM|nr:carboxylating nicotinate-nucleotide diphosphorylase [Gilvimarinus sp. SDUM040013]MDO3388373.1 carboxylating nicotinate-nucleotide diphosphorylase [Gilvimarinus sp. SDUM040013]MDX6847923.1 carboxylating nicotinate-nucleotide diphosphorylase [Gilvimarinus sp. SDUM040013]